MATSTSLLTTPVSVNQTEIDRLAEDFLLLAETQLAKMEPKARVTVLASIHASAESLREAR